MVLNSASSKRRYESGGGDWASMDCQDADWSAWDWVETKCANEEEVVDQVLTQNAARSFATPVNPPR
eukprot:12896526-Prorocentrum_lima.AAC.1